MALAFIHLAAGKAAQILRSASCMSALPSLSALQDGDEQAWDQLAAQLFPIALAAAKTKLY